MMNEKRLQEASNHLWYEIMMLHRLAPDVDSGVATAVWRYNALVESFAIHTRNLIDFLHRRRSQQRVIAAHYFSPQKSWLALCPDESTCLKTAENRAHQEIAHLTYARQNVKDKKWPAVEIVQELRPTIDLFIRETPKHLFGNRWTKSPF